MRLAGMIRKEWLQILRDPSSIAIAFALPVLLLFLFGLASPSMPTTSPWEW